MRVCLTFLYFNIALNEAEIKDENANLVFTLGCYKCRRVMTEMPETPGDEIAYVDRNGGKFFVFEWSSHCVF